MLFADLLSLHLVTFLMLFILVHVTFFSSRCVLELKFAIYYRAASLPSQASYAVLAEESQAFFKCSLHTNSISNSVILRNNYISLLKSSKFKVHCITLFGIALFLHQHNKTENTQKHRNTPSWDKYKFCGISTSRPDPLSSATYPEEATHLTVSDKLDSIMSIVLAATCARLVTRGPHKKFSTAALCLQSMSWASLPGKESQRSVLRLCPFFLMVRGKCPFHQ